MEISKSFRLSSQVAAGVLRPASSVDAGLGRTQSERVEPARESGLETQRRAAALAIIGELVESSDRESRRTGYEGLTNRARIAINAYQAQLDMHQDQARSDASELLGIDYYV